MRTTGNNGIPLFHPSIIALVSEAKRAPLCLS